MAEFYLLPRAVFYLITLLFGFCVLSQTLTMVLCYYRQPRLTTITGRGKWLFETLLELFVLIQIISCSLLHGQVHEGFYQGFYVPSGNEAFRIVVFAALLLLVAAGIFNHVVHGVSLDKKNPDYQADLQFYVVNGLLVLVTFLTLPVIERNAGKVFTYLFTAGLLFYLIRGIKVSILRYREIRTSLSAFSVKNAIDSMHTGVLFCESGGYILLSNARMEELIKVIFGGNARRNANHFYDRFMSGEINPACKKTEFEGQIVCLLPEPEPGVSAESCGGAWMFTRTELFIKRRKFIQLTAADITEQWRLTAQLQAKNDELKQRNEELNETIANLHILSRERETQKAKMHAHDILGQSLSVLLRSIRSGQSGNTPDYHQLHSLSKELLDQLKSDRPAASPHDALESLRQMFAAIGVEILLNGELPGNNEKALLVMEIIRESVTNAVRHGFATQITIQVSEDDKDKGCHVTITDNGKASINATPNGGITEGGGIGGMRKKLSAYGGTLSVVAKPGFILTIDLPKGLWV